MRRLTREEQDLQKEQEDLSLNNINLRLKKESYHKNKKTYDKKKPVFNENKNYKPKELIKASFYIEGPEPSFLFNALIQDIPEKNSVFKIENDVYVVKNITRNLVQIRPGALREIGIDLLVKRST